MRRVATRSRTNIVGDDAIHPVIQKHRWSRIVVPALRPAADDTARIPVLNWLNRSNRVSPGSPSRQEFAPRVREVYRSWSINSIEKLAQWMVDENKRIFNPAMQAGVQVSGMESACAAVAAGFASSQHLKHEIPQSESHRSQRPFQ